MKLRHLLAAAIVIGVGIRAPLSGQAPSDLNKVPHDGSRTAKQAGRGVKSKADRGVSHAHAVLSKATKNTKTGLKRPISVTNKGHSSKHKPRGAHRISQAGKHTVAKHSLKKTQNAAHTAPTKAGKDTKEEAIKKP